MRIAIIKKQILFISIFIITITLISISYLNRDPHRSIVFGGERAYQAVVEQVAFGPRTVGSQAHEQTMQWILDNLAEAGWEAEVQRFDINGHTINNIVAKRGEGTPWIILGAHYDSRFVADHDPDPNQRGNPVPGANDGASGVAVLLELARILPAGLDKQIWLVFFDAEDNGSYPGWEWIMGSRAFVTTLQGKPDAVIIVDMVGDSDLQLYQEVNSSPELNQEIWELGNKLGYSQFIPQNKHRLIDDHLPFRQADITAIDIIDFDYPYYHTVADTPDKVSAESLEAVGATLLAWLLK